MRKLARVAGVICTLLGALWFLQGLGVVHIRPILCFADCAPIQEPSPAWAIIGFLALAAGILTMAYSIKGRTRQ
jgi:hypothetical protein